jgi:hypothetical protein
MDGRINGSFLPQPCLSHSLSPCLPSFPCFHPVIPTGGVHVKHYAGRGGPGSHPNALAEALGRRLAEGPLDPQAVDALMQHLHDPRFWSRSRSGAGASFRPGRAEGGEEGEEDEEEWAARTKEERKAIEWQILHGLMPAGSGGELALGGRSAAAHPSSKSQRGSGGGGDAIGSGRLARGNTFSGPAAIGGSEDSADAESEGSSFDPDCYPGQRVGLGIKSFRARSQAGGRGLLATEGGEWQGEYDAAAAEEAAERAAAAAAKGRVEALVQALKTVLKPPALAKRCGTRGGVGRERRGGVGRERRGGVGSERRGGVGRERRGGVGRAKSG